MNKTAFQRDLKAGCCDTWPKPCEYHEGYLDGMEHALRLVADTVPEIEKKVFG